MLYCILAITICSPLCASSADEEDVRAPVKGLRTRLLRDLDIPASIRAFDRHFGQTSYSLKSLFKDERRRVVGILLQSVVNEAEAMYRQIYDNHAPLMRFLSDIPMKLPKALSVTSEFVINAALRRAFEDEPLDFGRIASLLDAVRRENLNLDAAGLSYTLTGRVNSLMQALCRHARGFDTLSRMNVLSRHGAIPCRSP